MKTRYVIFDVDGLMIDSEKIYVYAGVEAGKQLGYGFTEKDLLGVIGLSAKGCNERYRQIAGERFDEEGFAKLVNQLALEYRQRNPLEKKKGLDELLDYLDKKHYLKGVATSSGVERNKMNLSAVGIYDRFDYMICGDEIERAKPDPDIYLKILEKAGVSKEEALVLEDSRNGLLSAYNAGIRCILIPDIAYVPDEDKKKAYLVLEDLNQVIDVLEKE